MTRQKGWQWHRGIEIHREDSTQGGVKSRGDKAMGRKGGDRVTRLPWKIWWSPSLLCQRMQKTFDKATREIPLSFWLALSGTSPWQNHRGIICWSPGLLCQRWQGSNSEFFWQGYKGYSVDFFGSFVRKCQKTRAQRNNLVFALWFWRGYRFARTEDLPKRTGTGTTWGPPPTRTLAPPMPQNFRRASCAYTSSFTKLSMFTIQ